jgi:hypothetical protein
MSKYAPLGEFLRQQPTNEIPMSFDKIEKITGAKLPASATRHRAWWSNNSQNSVMTKVWLDAGFQSERVDIEGRKLVFRRVRDKAPPPAAANGPGDARDAAAAKHHPLYGWLKGTVRIASGVDLTQPADPEWGQRIDQ